MKQLTQELKSGKMELMEVPFPSLSKGQVLVRNHFSVINAGTEGKRVKDARAGYIAKAKSRKEEVKMVLKMAKDIGIKETYNLIMNKLETPAPLGYSTAGEVIGVAKDVTEFQNGDYVACAGGQHAFHSEVIAVPKNLCVRVSKEIPLIHAAYSTIGAIAMQGIRQADLHLGEICIVIGLGLIGQITLQILRAAGVKTIGIDIDNYKVKVAKKAGSNLAYNRNEKRLSDIILNKTDYLGADSVIITASSSSNDPVEFAGEVCRQKGSVIIVGAVPTGFSRGNYYKKELELKMSCSYGPGRYDNEYEEKNLDYPIGYVRWTENRNLKAFVDLLKDKKLNLDILTTHQFNFEDVKSAYDIIVEKKERYLGILLQYNVEKKIERKIILPENSSLKNSKAKIGFIGAGSYASKFLLPYVKDIGDLTTVITLKGYEGKNAAKKFGFAKCSDDADDIFKDKEINTVFVVTRHNLHAEFVIKALKAGKNVFVEKPLCMNEDELEYIRLEYEKSNSLIMVGFNRRFAPMTKIIKSELSNHLPKAINYRVNVGVLPKDHWTYDKEVGGGRIIGEACHFIDLCMYLANSEPVSVYSNAVRNELNKIDTINISISYKNGSIANISYFGNGSKKLNKEYLEVYCSGKTAILTDFKKLEIYNNKVKFFKSKLDKGQENEVILFIDSVINGKTSPISFKDLYMSTLTTFKVLESVQVNQKINLEF